MPGPTIVLRVIGLALLLCGHIPLSAASEELISTAQNKDGGVIPYILNYKNTSPKYIVILFPGGSGDMKIHMEDGKLAYGFKKNFVIRIRPLIVDDEFATVATNSSQSPERIQAILDDLINRMPVAEIYLMSTSKGTIDSMSLAGYLSGKIAGIIHTSSFDRVASFDAKKFKNRQLLVHHRKDDCQFTPFGPAQKSHRNFGTELLAMEGGISVGDVCEPLAHHGFNGIESETVSAIKKWIKNGRP